MPQTPQLFFFPLISVMLGVFIFSYVGGLGDNCIRHLVWSLACSDKTSGTAPTHCQEFFLIYCWFLLFADSAFVNSHTHENWFVIPKWNAMLHSHWQTTAEKQKSWVMWCTHCQLRLIRALHCLLVSALILETGVFLTAYLVPLF